MRVDSVTADDELDQLQHDATTAIDAVTTGDRRATRWRSARATLCGGQPSATTSAGHDHSGRRDVAASGHEAAGRRRVQPAGTIAARGPERRLAVARRAPRSGAVLSRPENPCSGSSAVLEAGELQLLEAWCASIRRTVPERERITIESVIAPVGRVADPAQERAVVTPGRGHEDVLARDEVVGRQHAVGVEAGVDELLALLVVARPELALDRRRRRTSAPPRRSRPPACRRSPSAGRRRCPAARRRSRARRRRRGSRITCAPALAQLGDQRPRGGRARARRRALARLLALAPARRARCSRVGGALDVDRVDRLRARRRSCPCRPPRPGRTSCRARRARSPRSRSAGRSR